MKVVFTLCLLSLFFVSCDSSEKLSKETAMTLLQEQDSYPKPLIEDIYIGDPEDAKRLLDLDLEEEGLVSIQTSQKLSEVGGPLITFTEKAQPYLVESEGNDPKIQQVKIADEEIVEIVNIQTADDGKSAIVEYRTSFENETPFAGLTRVDLEEENVRTANFVLSDEGWGSR
ncbi:hypothetical protein [Albibacterium profundi]|uniref:Uncharacterized protein n=1 Tax=Albibacterium profundi TaxID=3134906 RepID=A0ABV5CG57_9SPHI